MIARIISVVLLAGSSYAQLPQSPETYVNTLGGTKSRYDFSHGNILPEVTMPWGFGSWSPVTDIDQGSWFFYSESRRMYGIRSTRQPSPWVGDYGQFTISASLDSGTGGPRQCSSYSPVFSAWSPYYHNHTLSTYNTRLGATTVELTATNHGAILRFRFPPYASTPLSNAFNQTRRIWITLDKPSNDKAAFGTPGPDQLLVMTGTATSASGGVASNFGHYFYATVAAGPNGDVPVPTIGQEVKTTDGLLWIVADYDPTDPRTTTLTMRIATSMISPQQAQLNHATEVAGRSFESVMTDAQAAWRSLLSRVTVQNVGAYDAQKKNELLVQFYSGLYRAAKYPRNLWEVSAQGTPIHWSPYSGQTLPGPFVCDVGFWDAYRTTSSLTSLYAPEMFAAQTDGWLAQGRESGWIPQWSSPGFRGGMTGTMSDVTLSEAIVKLPHCGTQRAVDAGYCINATGLYAYSMKNAMQTGDGGEGRICLADYIAVGYVPADAGCDAVVTRSLNYWHSDWALAQAALTLNRTADATMLLNRARNFTRLLNPVTGHMQVKSRAGAFLTTFDEFAWGPTPGYTEAGSWHHRIEVPYNLTGLQAELLRIGQDGCAIMREYNSMPPLAHDYGYGQPIHELTEMLELSWGQWELGNQPSWAQQISPVVWGGSVASTCAHDAQWNLRRSLIELWRPDAAMFPGDEDNGSMGAWFVLNSLGLYPLSPASGDYVLGSPLFANVTIALASNATLVISAPGNGINTPYVASATWNGVPITGVTVSYAQLMKGGTLSFQMAASVTKH